MSSCAETRQPTEEDIEALLRDPACPRGRGVEEDVVPVLQFIAFAKSRGYATGEVESLADRSVQRLGGEQRHVVDPALCVPNLLRRLTGNVRLPTEDVWLLPPGTLSASSTSA
jgi:hypothetical protein